MKSINVYNISNLVSIACGVMLLVAILRMPIGYYGLLRIMVFFGAIQIVIRSYKEYLAWALVFTAIAILFNPIVPIYLYKKSIWMPLDMVVGILFLVEGFLNKKKSEEEVSDISEPKKEEQTYGRDRIL